MHRVAPELATKVRSSKLGIRQHPLVSIPLMEEEPRVLGLYLPAGRADIASQRDEPRAHSNRPASVRWLRLPCNRYVDRLSDAQRGTQGPYSRHRNRERSNVAASD